MRLRRVTALLDADARPGDPLYGRASTPNESFEARPCALADCGAAEPHLHRGDLIALDWVGWKAHFSSTIPVMENLPS